MYHIDGSSGGGSILRIGLPVALANRQDINILNIRKNRSKPGLRPQHLTGLQLLCEVTGSELKGGEVGSQEVNITAGKERITAAEVTFDTAASVSLVYQLLSNYCLLANTDVSVRFKGGGTHTNWSPNFDYLEQVTIPALERFGQKARLGLERIGYYPKGGAAGTIEIRQNSIPDKILFDQMPTDPSYELISRASNHLQNAKVAERQLDGFQDSRRDATTYYDQTLSPGSAITAWYRDDNCVVGFSALGKKGVRAEDVGASVSKQIKQHNGAAVDEHLADQLMVGLTSASSGSSITIPSMTDHVGTNFNLLNHLLDNTLKLSQQGGKLQIMKN